MPVSSGSRTRNPYQNVYLSFIPTWFLKIKMCCQIKNCCLPLGSCFQFPFIFFKYFDILWKVGRCNQLVWVDESKQQRDSGDIYCASDKLEPEVSDEGRCVAVFFTCCRDRGFPTRKTRGWQSRSCSNTHNAPRCLSVLLIMSFCRYSKSLI